MGRLSQDRDEREAMLREYDTDLRSEVRTSAPATKSSGGVTVGQVIVGILAVIVAIKVVPLIALWLFAAVMGVLRSLVGVAIVAGIGYLVYKWMTGKKRRI
ncbi:MAG: hypothetical protein HZB16_24040 [Armatimonadetes bacterium]|nr:hypothetical protein [Armatimonadota bacterium]